MDASIEASYRFGPFHVDGGARLLLRDGQPVSLAPKAFDLLCYLLAHAHRLIGKDELLKGIWPRGFVEEGNLSHNVFLLRKALGESPEEHRYIVTMPGRGYKFVGEVLKQGALSAPAPVAAVMPDLANVMQDSLATAIGAAAGKAGQTYSIAAGDFNGDGKLDLAVVNQVDGSVSILLNTTEPGAGNVSFAPATSLGRSAGTGTGAKAGPGEPPPSPSGKP